MAIKIFAYISPICREAPLGGIYMKFCMRGRLADVINRDKFYLNQVRGFDSVGGSNFWLSHKKEKSPLTQGLNYRSACDSNNKPRQRDQQANSLEWAVADDNRNEWMNEINLRVRTKPHYFVGVDFVVLHTLHDKS